MATSRDDFVIAIRSAFLKKGTQQRFSLIALIISSIILITLTSFEIPGINYLKISLNEIIHRTSFVASLPEKQIKKTTIKVKDHLNLYEDYLNTKQELKKLKAEKYNTNFIIKENQRLKKLIDEYIINSDELVAKVLLDKKSPFLRSVILNKGSKDEVEVGMAVLDHSYLIGKIVEVNYSTSRALLVSDLNSKIPVTIEPGNLQSILTGTGKNFGLIQYFKEGININYPSVVYTSGSGGIFKAGIPIGKIEKNLNNENFVNFFSKLSQLTFVKIISFNKES